LDPTGLHPHYTNKKKDKMHLNFSMGKNVKNVCFILKVIQYSNPLHSKEELNEELSVHNFIITRK
jgi:hypothetical protein